MASDIILRARDVSKHFGGLVAVDSMSVDVARGSLTGIIGPNGAGKTTFFNLLAGSLPATSGTITFEGMDVTRERAYRRARRGLARTFQLARALSRMTVRENLMLAPDAQVGESILAPLLAGPLVKEREAELREKADEMLAFFKLAHVADAYAGSLSGGQRKLLELARALMRDPGLVLLDEPMAGVNPKLAMDLMDMIEALRRDRGVTFVLVEHDLETVFTRCDPIIVMANGRKIAEGNAASVRADPAVIEAYLGGDAHG